MLFYIYVKVILVFKINLKYFLNISVIMYLSQLILSNFVFFFFLIGI